MQPFVVIIPARKASTRLPGKMLADLAGTPMVVRVAQRAAASDASEVLIATDDVQIARVVQSFGFRAVMTQSDHLSGTDRLAETVALLGLAQDAIVVNVQGDEPLIAPTLINQVAALLTSQPTAAIATCAAPIVDAAHFFNANIVKVVCDKAGKALYFSRAPIPWDRDALATESQVLSANTPALHHIGLYAYRVHFLKSFPHLSRGVLEGLESLEQLRALEHGYSIAVHFTDTHPGAGVDTEADLDRVRQVLTTKNA
ncbi:MAG: 3-deoxy-manno-octulosonate cytidylyltransferase [Burkholderiaceae bacterium]|nr:3-deoxy-manno-octulosonate cytidylyltransferase [Burkholderiaceae bacterium]